MRDGSGEHEQVALRAMLREVSRPDGVPRLIRWLAERVGGCVLLLDAECRPVHAFPGVPHEVLDEVRKTVAWAVAKAEPVAVADVGGRLVQVLPLNRENPDSFLVVIGRRGADPGVGSLLTDSARLLGMRWQMEDADRRRGDLSRAEAYNKEAILHLLMVGHVDGAKRTAVALRQTLPTVTCVYLIEAATHLIGEVAKQCVAASGGSAWVVRCPVYNQHLVVLASAEADGVEGDDASDSEHRSGGHARTSVTGITADFENSLRDFAARAGAVSIGAGRPVALREMGAGYEEAFHALAVARSMPERFAVFSPRLDLAAVLGEQAFWWARGVLAPLWRFVPERRQDPDRAELESTLRSWLIFYGGAAAQLKIHRNTLATRLKRIEHILDCDLADIATQARLQLALRLATVAGPAPDASDRQDEVPASDEAELDRILDSPAAYAWAEAIVSRLDASHLHLETVRTWLAHGAKLDATARALGVSVPAARKRLARIEALLGRSLLNGPSARYDLLFALRLHDPAPGLYRPDAAI